VVSFAFVPLVYARVMPVYDQALFWRLVILGMIGAALFWVLSVLGEERRARRLGIVTEVTPQADSQQPSLRTTFGSIWADNAPVDTPSSWAYRPSSPYARRRARALRRRCLQVDRGRDDALQRCLGNRRADQHDRDVCSYPQEPARTTGQNHGLGLALLGIPVLLLGWPPIASHSQWSVRRCFCLGLASACLL